MQFTSITSAVLLAALAGFPSLAGAVGCTMRPRALFFEWTVFDVAGVTDPNGLCNGLRDNIHGYSDCTESSWSCRMVGDRNRLNKVYRGGSGDSIMGEKMVAADLGLSLKRLMQRAS
ncbi:hypothetical protein PG984_007831 [Apiospora sp. TS-2023a]